MELLNLKSYIAGEFQDTQSLEENIIDPSNNELLGQQAFTSEKQLEEALASAKRLHQSANWSKNPMERARILEACADAVGPHYEELAELEAKNTGVCIKDTKKLMSLVPFIFRGAAAQARESAPVNVLDKDNQIELLNKPWGPALCLAPWNAPAPIAVHKLASAMAAGCPAIIKASEYTPYSLQKIIDIISQITMPAGAIQLVHGNQKQGAYLVKDKRIKCVSFTGGLKGGVAISQECAKAMKPVQLELGGHNPFIVLEGADVKHAASELIKGMTNLNGQWCRAVGQVLCHDSIKEQLIESFKEGLANLKIGKASDLESQMGPLIHRQHKMHLEQHLLEYQSLGAKLIHGDQSQYQNSCFMSPTLVSGLSIEQDVNELFGPIATIHGFKNNNEAITIVNDSEFGLAAYVFGPDENIIMNIARQLETGSVKGNGVTITSLVPAAPRAAWGVSGLGEEGNKETFEFFQGRTVVGMVNAKAGGN